MPNGGKATAGGRKEDGSDGGQAAPAGGRGGAAGEERSYPGRTICPGLAVGVAFLCEPDAEVPFKRISPEEVEREQARYDRAVREVSANLGSHVEEAHEESSLDVRQILGLHELMLADESFHRSVRSRIAQERINAERALADQAEQVSGKLEQTRDPYLEARVEDVWDMAGHILSMLSPPSSAQGRSRSRRMSRDSVAVSTNLYISQVMQARRAGARGYVTSSRALTSHAAILLKSFNIPALGGIEGLTNGVGEGDPVILDGLGSRLIVKPRRSTVQRFRARQRQASRLVSPGGYRPRGARTRDGTRINLVANIDHPNQTNLVLRQGLEGIGLFRTEFLLYAAPAFPDEDEQQEIYRRVVEAMRGRPVVLRTFDIGADKRVSYTERCVGQNPALGMRGIRRQLLRRPRELATQLRAALRAGAGGSLRLLFPMITTADELRQVKGHLAEAKHELGERGEPFCSSVEIGAMIEVPAAAISIVEILAEVDFVSVGTNDLIQYFTAADRDNEAVSHLADAHSSSVIFLLKHIMDRAVELGRQADVSVCGELASDPDCVPLLLRLGYRCLSISPAASEAVRSVVAQTDLEQEPSPPGRSR